jgi:hypothetical protein
MKGIALLSFGLFILTTLSFSQSDITFVKDVTIFDQRVDSTLSSVELSKDRIDDSKWKETTRNIDYYEKSNIPKKRKQLKENKTERNYLDRFIPLFQIVLLILVVLLIVGLVIYISKQIKQSNIQVKSDDAYWQIDLSKADSAEKILNEKLSSATLNQDFTVAIRLKYLQALNELNRGQLVVWRKDKTNADYIQELQGTDYQKEFALLTEYYENSWFGKFLPNKVSYEIICSAFSAFIKQLQPNKEKEK